ncbi:MAG: pyruvate kinase, partial [Candidatus Bathyarchaeia archaeon]
LTQDVRVKDRLLLDDGLIELVVEDKTATELYCRVLHGGSLGERKGINLPGTPLSIPSITDKDRSDLEFGIQQGVDYVALSFVRSAKDCLDAKQLIEHTANKVGAEKPPLIAKIEKAEALRELDAILEIADGIMVARGDLGIETSTESVPVYQKEMIRKANLIGKPVITATQMLQSMIENPRPTRAEASDVANAILDGTDAVMLSGETASGAFPVEAVKTMDRIVRFTEDAVDREVFGKMNRALSAISQHTGSYNRALAEAAVFAAEEIGSPIILVFTEGGKMARRVSSLSPRQKIVAFTYVQETYRRLAAIWGINSYMMGIGGASDRLLTHADQMLLRLQLALRGTTIVMVAGNLSGIPASNIVKLHRVGDFVEA